MVAGVIGHYWLLHKRLCGNRAANCHNHVGSWDGGGGGGFCPCTVLLKYM